MHLSLRSECHFPMGLPVATYLGYKYFNRKMMFLLVRILSILFFLLFSITYYFSISGYAQLYMNYITEVSQTVEYEKTFRQGPHTCRAHVAVKYRIPVNVCDV